jgi:hypothetical protein
MTSASDVIIRCQEGEMLKFQQVAMGAGPIEVAEQMEGDAEALFRSSGYEIKQSPTAMEAWTATWDVIVAPVSSSAAKNSEYATFDDDS